MATPHAEAALDAPDVPTPTLGQTPALAAVEYAAGACDFLPQHYRPTVCKHCFLAKAAHRPVVEQAQPQGEPKPAVVRASRWVATPAVASAAATPRVIHAPVIIPATVLHDPVIVAAATEPMKSESCSDNSNTLDCSSSSRDVSSSSGSVSTKDARGFSPNPLDGASSDAASSEEWASEEEERDDIVDDRLEDASTVPASSSFLPPPPPPPRSFSSDRGSLLRSIAARPTLRRASECAPLKEKPLVVDLNSELTWTIRRKKLNSAQVVAADAVIRMEDESKQQLRSLAHRLGNLGSGAAHPSSVDQLTTIMSERDLFVRAHASLLGSASLEQIERTWPSVKDELAQRFIAALDRLARAIRATERYTEEFMRHMERRGAQAAASSSVTGITSAHADWLVIDAQLLAQSMQTLMTVMQDLRKLVRDAEGQVFFVDVNPSVADASAAASALIDLMFERARMAYASTLSIGGSAASAAPQLTPHYSQTSKAIKSYQVVELSLSLFAKLQASSGAPPLVNFTLQQRELADELIGLKAQIEASTEYRASIAVTQRKGEWDKKEEVKLRSTSLNERIGGSTHPPRRESTSTGTSWIQPLRELRDAHPRLFLLLEKPAVAAAVIHSPKNDLRGASAGGLDDDEAADLPSDLPSGASELSTLLQPICALPLPLLTQFVLRHIIPAQNVEAFQLVVTRVLLPLLEADQDRAEVQSAVTQIFFECASKAFREGILMCIRTDESNLSTLGLDVNLRSLAQGNGSNTALHLAAAGQHVELMTLLIRNGANPLAVNAFERTALFSLRQLFGASTDLKPTAAAAATPSQGDDSQAPINHAASYMSRYFLSPRLSDVRLRLQQADGEVVQLHAHRLVLCAQSEVFRVLLDEDRVVGGSSPTVAWESSLEEDDVGPPSVLIADVTDAAAFTLFLRYLYTGTVMFTNDDLHLAASVLDLATRFLVEPLRARIAAHLSTRIVPQNAASLYNLAAFTSSRLLQQRVEQFVIAHYADQWKEFTNGHAASEDETDLAPHAFLRRILSGMDVDGLRQASKEKKPRWHV